MSDITINYKGSSIATMDASGTKTLLTEGKYCEDDIEVVYVKPGGGGGTPDDLAKKTWPSGSIEFLENVMLNMYSGFRSNTAITAIKGDEITAMDTHAFNYCSNLESIDFKKLTRLGQSSFGSQDSYSFGNCPKLTQFNLPLLDSINGQYTFSGCGTSSNKATIALPAIVNLSSRTFRSGYFAAIDLGPNLSTASSRGIRDQTFYSGQYDVVILRAASVIPTTNADAIRNLTTEKGCTIYVPQALLSTYPTSTNWSSAARTFAAIEGSYYATHYADGTLIPT